MPTELVGTMDRVWPIALLDTAGRELPCRFAHLVALPWPGRGRQEWIVGHGDTPELAAEDASRRWLAVSKDSPTDTAGLKVQVFECGIFIPVVFRFNGGQLRWRQGELYGADILAGIGQAMKCCYPKIAAHRLPVVIRKAGKMFVRDRSDRRHRSTRLTEGG